jgi:hypothetical protein
MDIKVVYQLSDLETHSFEFYLSGKTLVLQVYAYTKQETKRHKPKAVKIFNRLNKRESNITLKEVPFSEFPNVINQAKQNLITSLVYQDSF